MTEKYTNLPGQKELEKEIGDYLTRKYGKKVKIISSGLVPLAENAETEDGEKSIKNERIPFDFHITPEELVAYLDQYVVRQNDAKDILATKVCTHFNRIRFGQERQEKEKRSIGRIKNNVLLIGPTGVGKTFLIKLIAERLGVPFIKGDATKFSETGYVGGDVEDLVRDLVLQAEGDIERAQYGIIYVDEVDKIASSEYRIGADVSRTGVQRALLKPMEETDVELKVPHDPISQIEAIEQYRATGKRERRVVNTRNILFIMSGAFAGLEEIIKKRVQQQSIGFESTISSPRDTRRFLKEVKADDLIQFGFESEFVGRLPVIAVLHDLNEDDFFNILLNPNSSVIVAKKQDFRAYGIELQFEDDALREIARAAIKEKTGARGLVSVMEKILLLFEKKLPSTQIRHLVMDVDMVHNPREQLEKLLQDSSVQERHRRRYQELADNDYHRLMEFILHTLGDYLESHEVLATPRRLELMARMCQKSDMDPGDVCEIFIRLVQAIHECAGDSSSKWGIQVRFSEEAIDRLLSRQPNDLETIRKSCESILLVMEYGLRLLSQKKGVTEVVIPEEGIDLPEKFINKLVGETFKVE
jgi:endopeptidase Clp ATP-binding regulatory subunit ClpX